jgi:1-acyl-sn-glycerol-3-phosphate acyltransferase
MTPTLSEQRPGRDGLVSAILQFLGAHDLHPPKEVRELLEREIDLAGPTAVAAMKERLTADDGWTYYGPDPLARRIHHLLADRFLLPASGCNGLEHVAAIEGDPVVLFSNHLSYSDANVIEVLLHRAGATSLAGRLTAIAGPKIFTSRERRFSSLCFGTVKVPQSAEVSSGEAVIDAREVARAARQSIEAARSRLAQGDALVLFGEGTRSRTAAMQPMLQGVARYLDVPGTWVLPCGLTGPERLFPVERVALQPAELRLNIGAPFKATDLIAAAEGDRRIAVDAIGLAIAALLPEHYRGAYAASGEFEAARSALTTAQRKAATDPD